MGGKLFHSMKLISKMHIKKTKTPLVRMYFQAYNREEQSLKPCGTPCVQNETMGWWEIK